MSGIVAAGNHYTAEAGEEILAGGGNAVDAAVGATFVSFLGEIAFVHSGGSGLAMLYDSAQDRCELYDFFSAGPGLATTSNAAKDFHNVTVNYGSALQDFHVGRASVAVPGNFFGLCRLVEDYGSLPLSRLLEPAITLALEGVILDYFQAETCKILEPIFTHTPEMREIFCPQGHLVREGERIRIPALAHTFQELAREGEDYLRRGGLAQALLEDQQNRGGLLTKADLLNYQVEVRRPLACDYHGTRVWLPSLPSSGGPLIGLALQVLERLHVTESERIPTLIEVMAAVNRSRRQWDDWTDTLAWQEAPFRLWAETHIEDLVRQIVTALEQGRTDGSVSEPPAPSATTHLSVIDGKGLAVSLTHTAGESAGFVVPGTGFIPNNMMGEADLHPKGFHSTVPGTRILTMMAPSILTSSELGCVALGSGGSTRIRSALLQVIHHLVDRKRALPEAVEEPRVHFEAGVLQVEAGDLETMETARRFGYDLNVWQGRHLYFGGANAVSRSSEGTMQGCGDPRRGGVSRLATGHL